jgi:hypothetical protein
VNYLARNNVNENQVEQTFVRLAASVILGSFVESAALCANGGFTENP